MGNLCSSCFGGQSSYDDLTPDIDTRRRQQQEAAERRIAEQEGRGIKSIESVRRKERQATERDKLEWGAGNTGAQGGLKWQVN